MRIIQSCFPLLHGLALGACASPGAQPNQPTAPAPTAEVELQQAPAPGASAAPAEPTEEDDSGQEFGMIGLLNTDAGDPDAPTAPWGRDDSLGHDSESARGGMWGDEIGESFGTGGLGLSGISGGGGNGEGIGLGTIGTIGGPSSGHGKLGRAPRVRMGATSVAGKLPPEVIQRIVRQNFGRFRLCYEKGLLKDPKLQGRVEVQFVIGRDGKVTSVQGGGSMPDAAVVSCVTAAFHALLFPQPEGGIVTVKYPIVFTPATGSSTPGSSTTSSPTVAGIALAKASASDVYKALELAKCQVVSSTTVGGATKFLAKRGGHTFTVTFVPATGASALSQQEKAKLANARVHRDGASLLAVKSNDAAASDALLGELVRK